MHALEIKGCVKYAFLIKLLYVLKCRKEGKLNAQIGISQSQSRSRSVFIRHPMPCPDASSAAPARNPNPSSLRPIKYAFVSHEFHSSSILHPILLF